MGNHYHYQYKDWILKYSFWMGLLELVFLNILGILWIVRAYRLKKYEDYQPKLMYWLNVWYTFASMVALTLWLLPYQAKTRTFSVKYEVDEYSWLSNLFIILFFIALYCLPLLGIKRVRVPKQ